MHRSPDQARRPQKQRPDLNLNTAVVADRSRDVGPESLASRKSPFPAKGKPPVSNRGLKLPASTSAANSKRNSEESFLDNDNPLDGHRVEPDYRHFRPPRDSHDLSLPSQNITRDSLLGNMLNSLDQFSLSQINTPIATTFEDDGDPYGVPRGDLFTRSMTSTSRPPANPYTAGNPHAHGYSYSSDFEGFDDAASRISSQVSRGRRSDSSSGFQSGLPRINSMRERSHPGTPGKQALHTRGGKASKSSSLNSFDVGGGGYTQGLPSQRWGHEVGGRSSSFDYGQRPSLNSPGPWKTEFSNNAIVDDYEAAPNPTVPGGPRRPLLPSFSTAASPSAPPSEYEPKTPDRKRDARSRSGTNKTAQSKFVAPRDPAPPLPQLDVDSAPAPLVGYGKSKDPQQTASVSTPPVKEKQGFFSRLFGSRPTPSPTPTAEVSGMPASSIAPESSQSGTSKMGQATSQMKPSSAPPTRDSESSRQMPHVIQKKSSFFRRRKKSIAEPPVPPLPVPHQIDIQKAMDISIPKAEPSPVSSLRQVMNPYLRGSIPVTPLELPTSQRNSTMHAVENETRGEDSRNIRGFSPEYEPAPSATIRTVKSTSALKTQDSRWRGRLESPLRNAPDLPTNIPKSSESTTFFHDSSDEGEKGKSSTRKQRQRAQTGKPGPAGTAQKSKTFPTLEHQGPPDVNLFKPEPSTSLLQTNPREQDQGLSSREPSVSGINNSSSRPTLSRSASSVPSVTVDSSLASPQVPSGPLDEPEVTVGEPTDDERQKAHGIFDGDEDFIQKEKAAAWMGEEGPVRQRTLQAYMDLYDFENESILAALRQVCSRLVFRAETQQVDRILVAFSKRWCQCNPNHGFKTRDVVHTLCYSIMLLNTDLHMAEIEHKMTRSQFVKNTMSTVTRTVVGSAPEALNPRASILPPKNSLLSPAESETPTSGDGEQEKPSWRASFKPLPRSESSLGFHNDSGAGNSDTCGPLVKAPFEGNIRAWEGQVEIVLKDIYVSIRDERLPLFGADPGHQQPQQSGGLAVINRLKRTPSVLSKAPSESQASLRGRINEAARTQGGRWSSKSRSRPRLGNGFSSSRTSFEDESSFWSPATSSATWSRHSLGRTQTSMSIDSISSGYPKGDYQQSIGFANALSQAIIRDDYPIGNSAQSIMSDDFQGTQLLEDESLELLGPPWVKEGIVTHKHHLDGFDKKAKDRNWVEVFAVVQKGTMSLFSFSTKSMRQKARTGRKPAAGAVVGGGNWQENATSLGSFSLKQTLASALPSPGYSRTRPNVWALSLPSGAVHLFQVGTPEISKEFVLTVNYWSARLSTHPLVGGISNIEYGWSEDVINNALIMPMDEPALPQRPGSAAAGRTSTHSRQGSRQSSLRSSFDVGGNIRTKLPGDRIHIAEWAPPSQSLRPSQCSESEQLETLVAYVKAVEDELQQHNQLRSPMLLAFTPRGHNAAKAMANWERKSNYLLREIIKFRTYVDSLQHARDRRNEIYTERENARRAARGEDIDDSASAHSDDPDVTLKA